MGSNQAKTLLNGGIGSERERFQGLNRPFHHQKAPAKRFQFFLTGVLFSTEFLSVVGFGRTLDC